MSMIATNNNVQFCHIQHHSKCFYDQLTDNMNKQISNTLIVKGHHLYFNFTIFGPRFIPVFSGSQYNNIISKRTQDLCKHDTSHPVMQDARFNTFFSCQCLRFLLLPMLKIAVYCQHSKRNFIKLAHRCQVLFFPNLHIHFRKS